MTQLLNRSLIMLLKSNIIVQDVQSYVVQFGFEAILKEAISFDKVDVVKSLNKLRAVSTTELFSASSNNALKVAEWLVETKKANVNMCSEIFKDTPLNSAARHGSYKVAEYLMEVLRDKELSRELQEGYFFWKNLCLNLR